MTTGLYAPPPDSPSKDAEAPVEARGMYVALLSCGHSHGPGSGYVGPIPGAGDLVVCKSCVPPSEATIQAVVPAGPILQEGRRW